MGTGSLYVVIYGITGEQTLALAASTYVCIPAYILDWVNIMHESVGIDTPVHLWLVYE